jgi:hypothetical protein
VEGKVVISSYGKVNEKVEVKYRISEVYMYTSGSHIERIAFAIVPDEVRYPDRIVGIALLLWSMQ